MTQSNIHSVDDLLITGKQQPVNVEPPKKEPEAPAMDIEVVEPDASDYGDDKESQPDVPRDDVSHRTSDEPEKEVEKPASDLDEYGNPVPKSKVYTEEEVQQMVRDRLTRDRMARNNQAPVTQQQVNDAQQSFQYDEESNLTWQQQLDNHIRHTVKSIREEESTLQRKYAEESAQQAFEAKFLTDMSKYSDFVDVVGSKPITNDMMKGIRGLKNPVAFLYAAAKQQPAELDRISKIQDPYQQAAEMGRLHEKMVKTRPNSSNASKPLIPKSADVADSAPMKVSIEDRIHQYGKEKIRR